MKKLLCISCLLLAVFTLVSCKEDTLDAPVGMIEASNDNVNYQLYIPDNWIPETDTGVITAKRSDSVLVNVSMMGAVVPDDISTAEDYWAYHKENFSAALGGEPTEENPDVGFKIIEENVEYLLDEHKACKYVYTGNVSGAQAQYMQIICLRGDVVYIFTYTASPDLYEEYLPDVEMMLEHFSFND